MKVLWICALPLQVQRSALQNQGHGAQVSASWILAHLPAPAGIDLHIGCLWPGGDQMKTVEFGGTPVHLLPCPRRGRSLSFFHRDHTYFQPLFDELKPDVVHGWGTEDSFALVAERLAPTRHLVGIQGLINAYRSRSPMYPRTIILAITERRALAKARYVVAESEYALREAGTLCGPGAKLAVIEHPLRNEFLNATPSDGQAKVVLIVAALQKRKGIDDALIAFSRSAPADWNIHVVGGGAPGPEQQLHQLVRRLGLGKRFQHTRTGDGDDLVSFMQASSIFLLPSRADTGPTALKEAITMGLWPVCYDNSGPGEYIRKYGIGSLAEDGNINSLAEKLQRLFTQRPWLPRSNWSALAIRTRHDFSPVTAWKRLDHCYSSIATGKNWSVVSSN